MPRKKRNKRGFKPQRHRGHREIDLGRQVCRPFDSNILNTKFQYNPFNYSEKMELLMECDHLQQDVKKVFELEGVVDSQILKDKDGTTYKAWIAYTWAAVIDDELVISGIQTIKFQQNKPLTDGQSIMYKDGRIIYDNGDLIPGTHKTAMWMLPKSWNSSKGLDHVLYLDLPLEEDHIGLALTSMNMVPPFMALVLDGAPHHTIYDVFTWTALGKGYFSYQGNMSQSPNMKVFWEALMARARLFADTYKDPDLRKFLLMPPL
jgi:hypothetical protein